MVHKIVDRTQGMSCEDMSKKRQPKMAPERYRRLLEKAAREFAEAGVERASLNTIISSCSMSKSSFYHYFESKQALFETVVDEAAAALAKDLAVPDPASLAGPDFWDRIAAFTQHAAAVSAQQTWYRDLGRLFYLIDHTAGQNPAQLRVLEQAAGWLADALVAGRACGAVRNDLPATLQAELVFAVLQAMDRWSVRHMHEFDADTRLKLAMQQLAALRSLLEPR